MNRENRLATVVDNHHLPGNWDSAIADGLHHEVLICMALYAIDFLRSVRVADSLVQLLQSHPKDWLAIKTLVTSITKTKTEENKTSPKASHGNVDNHFEIRSNQDSR